MKYLLILLCWFMVADGIATQTLVRSGLVREGNPFMASAVGEGHFLLLKVVGVLLCVWILWGMYRHIPRTTLITTSCVVVFYWLVMFWNLGIFLGI